MAFRPSYFLFDRRLASSRRLLPLAPSKIKEKKKNPNRRKRRSKKKEREMGFGDNITRESER